ncbi:unnamed protein product [Litomosoides sigmodontis]|uniref:Transmembrane protein n=1 Tax=Litomosoides sigmodontis TaxID=42156 RepID=A0A3P6SQI9_LITSI|nr:unnamed protein product [Litomosoides sigmodontis]
MNGRDERHMPDLFTCLGDSQQETLCKERTMRGEGGMRGKKVVEMVDNNERLFKLFKYNLNFFLIYCPIFFFM